MTYGLIKGKEPYLIAEIGQNHNGRIGIAKQIIDAAARCGFHAVKSAKRDIAINVPEPLYSSPYNSPHSFGKTYGEHREALEFSFEHYAEMARYAHVKGLDFISSFTDIPSLEFLLTMEVDALKIASSRVTDVPLLKAVAASGKPVILSTGMSTLQEIDAAVAIFEKCELYMTQCTSSYPCKLDDIHLGVMASYEQRYNRPVGFSGHHTDTILPDLLAAGLGACIIERHVTLDRTMRGSDQLLSLDEAGMKSLVEGLAQVKAIIGDPDKKVQASEEPGLKKLRNLSIGK